MRELSQSLTNPLMRDDSIEKGPTIMDLIPDNVMMYELSKIVRIVRVSPILLS